MNKLEWTEIPIGVTPATELSLGTNAAKRAWEKAQPIFGVKKEEAQGCTLTVLTDAFHVFRSDVLENFRICADRFEPTDASDLAEEIRCILDDSEFSIFIPLSMCQQAIHLIEECFESPADAVLPRKVLTE